MFNVADCAQDGGDFLQTLLAGVIRAIEGLACAGSGAVCAPPMDVNSRVARLTALNRIGNSCNTACLRRGFGQLVLRIDQLFGLRDHIGGTANYERVERRVIEHFLNVEL
jgi:hypothetical protein